MALPALEVKVEWVDQYLKAALNRSLTEPSIRTMSTASMTRIGKQIVADMKASLRRHRKIDTQTLYNAIDFVIEGRRGQQTLRVGPRAKTTAAEPYDAVIEFGRRPGSRMPPSGALLPWMARHGIPAEAEFPIRRAIGERGLEGQPFPYMDEGWEASQGFIDTEMVDLLNAVKTAWDSFRG